MRKKTRNILLIPYLLFISLLVASCATFILLKESLSPPEKQFAYALDIFHQGRYGKATDEFFRFERDYYNHALMPKVNYLIGLSYFNRGKYAPAERFLAKASLFYPQLADYAQYRLAQSYQRQNNLYQAIITYKYLTSQFPFSRFRTLAELGIADCYFELGQFSYAQQLYQEFQKNYPATPNLTEILFKIAVCWEEKDESMLAATGYRNVWLKFPLDPYAEGARRRMEKILGDDRTSLTEPSPDQLFERSLRVFEANKYKQALEEFSDIHKSIGESGDDKLIPALLLKMGICHYRLGNSKKATKLFNKIINGVRTPEREEALFWTGKLYEQAGNKKKARQIYQQITEEYPADSHRPSHIPVSTCSLNGCGDNSLFKLALLSRDEGDSTQSVDYYSQIIEKYPGSPLLIEEGIIWRVGWHFYTSEDYEQALVYFRKLKENRFSDPKWVRRALYWVARCQENLGQMDEAARAYLNLINYHPPSYYGILARSRYLKMGMALPGGAQQTFSQNVQPGPAPSSLPSPADSFNLERARELKELKFVSEAKEELRIVEERNPPRETLLIISRFYFLLEDYQYSQLVARNHFGAELEKPPEEVNLDIWQFAYTQGYRNLVENYARQYEINPNLIYSVIQEESRFRSEARSRMNALGLMQIIPPTGKVIAESVGFYPFDQKHLYDPEINIGFGTYYLKSLIEQFQGNVLLALAGYNGGPHNVTKWLGNSYGEELDRFVEDIPFRETRNYVKKVLSSYAVYNRVYGGEMDLEKDLYFPIRVGARDFL
ncbi:MAG: tetratricopeptide repeat protein [Deltaproteobacteria bacterium]|nr:MAG: tetratricopeptide repeat protein [Deltaproteobacteria bacterium]